MIFKEEFERLACYLAVEQQILVVEYQQDRCGAGPKVL